MSVIKHLKTHYALFLHQRWLRFAFRTTAIIFIIIILLLAFLWNRLPPQLPLYYSLPWGEAQVGTPLELIAMLFLAGLLFGTNMLLAILFFQKHRFFAHTLFFGGIGIVALMLITTVKIVLLIL